MFSAIIFLFYGIEKVEKSATSPVWIGILTRIFFEGVQ